MSYAIWDMEMSEIFDTIGILTAVRGNDFSEALDETLVPDLYRWLYKKTLTIAIITAAYTEVIPSRLEEFTRDEKFRKMLKRLKSYIDKYSYGGMVYHVMQGIEDLKVFPYEAVFQEDGMKMKNDVFQLISEIEKADIASVWNNNHQN